MSADLTRFLTFLLWAALAWAALALAVGAARDRVNQSPVGPRTGLLTYDDACECEDDDCWWCAARTGVRR